MTAARTLRIDFQPRNFRRAAGKQKSELATTPPANPSSKGHMSGRPFGFGRSTVPALDRYPHFRELLPMFLLGLCLPSQPFAHGLRGHAESTGKSCLRLGLRAYDLLEAPRAERG